MSDADSREGGQWIVSRGIDVPGWELVAPSATFADARVAGFTGCNRFTAEYAIDGETLRIGPIASTRMACMPPADEVERVYLDALNRVKGCRVDNSELVLVDGDGAELLRYRVEAPGPG